MAEFKKGDPIVFVEDDADRGIEMPKGTRGTYDGHSFAHTLARVRLDSGERVRAWRAYIAPAEDHGTGDGSASDICAEPGCNCDLERRFPAPLDPAKVAITLKGGDYIEAESDGTKIGGKVSHVTERGFVAIEHLGEFAVHHITASPLPEGYRMFVLTAHTPAPEPEPKWEPGTAGTATLNNRVSGNSSVGLRAMRTLRDDVYGFAFANGLTVTDDATTYSVTDFVPDEPRPLPTRDEVHELITNGDGCCDTTDVVMALLRGEAR